MTPSRPSNPGSPLSAHGLATVESGPGFDFVRDVTRDISTLASSVATVRELANRLLAEAQEERRARQGDVEALHDRLAKELSEKGERIASLETRFDSHESQSRVWIGSLGKEILGIKERLTASEELGEKLERSKSNAADHECLANSVVALRAEVARDRATTEVGLKAAALAHELRGLEARVDSLQRSAESTRQTLSSDLASLETRVDASAKDADLQSLDRKTVEIDRLLRLATEELGNKSTVASLKSVSDRLTKLTMDVQANQIRWRAELDALMLKSDSNEKGLSKAERQIETERDRSSNCFVSLEKELQLRATCAEADKLARRLSGAEEQLQKLAIEEVEHLRARTKALETEMAKKFDADDAIKQGRLVTDLGSELDNLKKRTHQQGTSLERMDLEMHETMSKLEAAARRADELQADLERKVDTGTVQAEVEENLRGYYKRDEVDGLLSRVWWRMGDIAKGSGARPSTRA